MATLRRWLDRFDAATLDRHPVAAALAACGFAFVGEPREADRWVGGAVISTARERATAAARRRCRARRRLRSWPWPAPSLCRDGVDQMLADATPRRRARARLEPVPGVRARRRRHGQPAGRRRPPGPGPPSLAAADGSASDLAAHPARSSHWPSSPRWPSSAATGRPPRRTRRKARSVVIGAGLDDYPLTAARVRGRRPDDGPSWRPRPGPDRPGPSRPDRPVADLRDPVAGHPGAGRDGPRPPRRSARAMPPAACSPEIDAILERRPDVGGSAGTVDGLRAQLATRRQPTGGWSRSPRPSCGSCRCCRPISRSSRSPRLHVLSPNTVKTQAISIYRKLGASSRSDAVARARELGLLEG